MPAPRTRGLAAVLTGLAMSAAGYFSANPAAPAAAAARDAATPAAGCADPAALGIVVRGATLCASIDDRAHSIRTELLRDWIDRSARIVAAYYARFPAPLVVLRIRVEPGTGVRGGRTTNDSGPMIQVSVGADTTAGDLAADWVLVHEMVHLALPEIGRRHNWLAEGLAVYVEGVARAQFGNRDIADVWAENRRSMAQGLPQAGEGGMDESPSWGRTYWGGALFCLQADVKLRERTHNRAGLQTALRAILEETGGYRAERGIDDVLRIGDAATGTRVLQGLYQANRAAPVTPDLAQLWQQLGVPEDPKSQPFDDHAPLAAIRIAITREP
ncbi:MAG: hypothetical protein ACYDBZ_05055 [Steroidobacteraceae bacterium]